MAQTLTYLYGMAATVYLTTCLVSAAVRWFHMCRPYNRNPSYYYPGRPFVTGAWLSALALLPYVFHPESADAWFVARLYFLPVTIYHFTLLLFSYFGSVMEWKKWRWPMVLTGTPVVAALVWAVVVAISPGEQTVGSALPEYVLYILGGIITFVCVSSIVVVVIWARRFDSDDYSNPADFPVVQAQQWMGILLTNMALCWTGAVLNDPTVLAVIQLIIAASCVVFVISALHPHRNRPVGQIQDVTMPSHPDHLYQRTMSATKRKEIIEAIKTVVEKQEAFTEQHLTLQDVSDRTGYNRTYIAGIMKSEFGGFFTYVNRLRLEHVSSYLKSHRKASVGEAAEAAGFASRQTYYTMKERLTKK